MNSVVAQAEEGQAAIQACPQLAGARVSQSVHTVGDAIGGAVGDDIGNAVGFHPA